MTAPQHRTLQKIRTFMNQRGFPPTMIELGEMLGISSISVYGQVNQLVRKGYLRREPRKARGITIIREPDVEFTGMEPVMVVGQVSAGHLMFAEENIIGEVLVEKRIACSGRCFAIKVKGDSMIDAGINDGDFVVIRKQPIAESGDIVVVLIGDEGTVKRLYIRDNIIELRPENPKHRPTSIDPGDDLRIIGRWWQSDRNIVNPE
ncbi:MAG: transcriptional repressor LexA [Candidatus Hatepunaea meridiana]|nr:transcriptional repressor LexA [Candidatus Hatepunaea meridiana]